MRRPGKAVCLLAEQWIGAAQIDLRGREIAGGAAERTRWE